MLTELELVIRSATECNLLFVIRIIEKYFPRVSTQGWSKVDRLHLEQAAELNKCYVGDIQWYWF